MIYFTGHIPEAEMFQLREKITQEAFCIIDIEENKRHGGVVKTEYYPSLVEVLSVRTLRQLEYLDKKDARLLRVLGRNKNALIAGNNQLFG